MEKVLCWVCQAEAERWTWLLSGHCCAERGGHTHWGAGVPPTPGTTSSLQSPHILGSSRMHLWSDVLRGER